MIGGVTRTRRRAIGVLGLTMALAPSLVTAAVSLHVLLESDHLAEHVEPDLEGPLHGHGHESTAPEHQHVVIVPPARPAAIASTQAAIMAATFPPGPTAHGLAVTNAASRDPYGGLGPPPRAQSIVILRI